MLSNFLLLRHDGEAFLVPDQGLTIGRHSTNDIVIADANVSRQHARILIAAGKCWIRDENSALGTIVNGQPVPGQQEFIIGDVLHIGNTAFRLIPLEQHQVLEQHPIVSKGNKKGNQNMVIIAGGVILLLAVLAVFMGSSGKLNGGDQPDDSEILSPTQDPWDIAVIDALDLLTDAPAFEEHLTSYADTADEIDSYLIFADEAQIILDLVDFLQGLEFPIIGNAWDMIVKGLNLKRPGAGLALSGVESGLRTIVALKDGIDTFDNLDETITASHAFRSAPSPDTLRRLESAVGQSISSLDIWRMEVSPHIQTISELIESLDSLLTSLDQADSLTDNSELDEYVTTLAIGFDEIYQPVRELYDYIVDLEQQVNADILLMQTIQEIVSWAGRP